MLNTSSEITNVIKENTDTFMAFSKIAFSSIEQLITLNLSTTRSLLEENATAAASVLDSNGAISSSKAKKATSLAVSETAADYFRSVQDIATKAQEEVGQLMTTYLASQSNRLSHPAGWLKGFDAFSSVGQQVSALTEASRKAMTDVTSQVVKQTNVQLRKSA